MAKPKDSQPVAAEVASLRAHLRARGVQAADDNDAIGVNPVTLTRQQIADRLRAWLKERPKGP